MTRRLFSSHSKAQRAPVWVLLFALFAQLWPAAMESAASDCEMMEMAHTTQMMQHHDMMDMVDFEMNATQDCCKNSCECRISACFANPFIGNQSDSAVFALQQQVLISANRKPTLSNPNTPFRPPIIA